MKEYERTLEKHAGNSARTEVKFSMKIILEYICAVESQFSHNFCLKM